MWCRNARWTLRLHPIKAMGIDTMSMEGWNTFKELGEEWAGPWQERRRAKSWKFQKMLGPVCWGLTERSYAEPQKTLPSTSSGVLSSHSMPGWAQGLS